MAITKKPAIANTKKIGKPKIPPDVVAKAMHQIFLDIAGGMSAIKACERPGAVSWGTFWAQLHEDTDTGKGYLMAYERARAVRLDRKSEALEDIAADGRNDWMQSNDPNNPGYKLNGEHVQRSKLRVDTLKWELSKLAPRFKDEGGGGAGSISAAQMQAWCDEVASRLPV